MSVSHLYTNSTVSSTHPHSGVWVVIGRLLFINMWNLLACDVADTCFYSRSTPLLSQTFSCVHSILIKVVASITVDGPAWVNNAWQTSSTSNALTLNTAQASETHGSAPSMTHFQLSVSTADSKTQRCSGECVSVCIPFNKISINLEFI